MKNKITKGSTFALFSFLLIARSGVKDEQFLKKASAANQAEIAFGKIAKTHASTDSVKQMAGQMMADYQRAEKDLQQVFKRIGLPTQMFVDSDHVAKLQTLEKLSGEKFDAFYLNTQNLDHQEMTSLYKIEILEGSDSSAKSYAVKYLPVLERNLKRFHEATTGLLNSNPVTR